MRNRTKLRYRKFQLEIRHHLLTVRLVEQQHRLPREIAVSILRDNQNLPEHGPEKPAVVGVSLRQRAWSR